MPGEIVGVVGATGAGKTTLLRLAAGLLAPDAGVVSVLGGPPDSQLARRGVGYAPDGAVFPPALSVREVLDYYARLHVAGPRRRALVARALTLGELADVAERRAAALSRGEAQRWLWHRPRWGDGACCCWMRRCPGWIRWCAGCCATAGAAGPGRRGGAAGVARSHGCGAAGRTGGDPRARPHRAVGRAGRAAARAHTRGGAGPAAGRAALGFRVTATGLECDLGADSVEAALAVCRAHRLAVRASRVRLRTLEDAVLETLDAR